MNEFTITDIKLMNVNFLRFYYFLLQKQKSSDYTRNIWSMKISKSNPALSAISKVTSEHAKLAKREN